MNQSTTPLRLAGYEIDKVKYWIATSRYDLTDEQIPQAYKLRWDIKSFFAWWKKLLKVVSVHGVRSSSLKSDPGKIRRGILEV